MLVGKSSSASLLLSWLHWLPVFKWAVTLSLLSLSSLLTPYQPLISLCLISQNQKNKSVSCCRTCESFFSFELNLESNRPYTTQAVTQRNGLQAIGILYLWRTRVMYGLRNSELSTCLFQFSHITRQTMLLYAYFTPKVDFKRKFNHHQSFLYEWRLTARTIRKFWIGPSIRIESRIGRTIWNRTEPQSFAGP